MPDKSKHKRIDKHRNGILYNPNLTSDKTNNTGKKIANNLAIVSKLENEISVITMELDKLVIEKRKTQNKYYIIHKNKTNRLSQLDNDILNVSNKLNNKTNTLLTCTRRLNDITWRSDAKPS
jgi:signal recognition particle subunit SEC65